MSRAPQQHCSCRSNCAPLASRLDSDRRTNGRTDEERGRGTDGRTGADAPQSARTTRRSAQIRRRRRLTISPGHVGACPDARRRCGRVYHKTNSTSEPRRAAPGRPVTFAERQCVGPDYGAVRRRTADRFRSYLARPAPTRRPGASAD